MVRNFIAWMIALITLVNVADGARLKAIAKLSTRLVSAALASASMWGAAPNAYAFGPQTYELKITDYKQVELCNGRKPIMPGQKAAEGLYPVCVEVGADIVNVADKSKLAKDVAVYGFVKDDEAGNSVLPNNPDFNTDAGQYAMIPEIKPGDKHITYQFVAAVTSDPKKSPLPKLTFVNTKGVSFPGGEKFKPLDECEIDPRAPGCDEDDE